MKSQILIFILFVLSISHSFSQCDSVRVSFNYHSGDCGDDTYKTVEHFNSAGQLLYRESFVNGYPNYTWERNYRESFTYDTNGNILSRTIEGGAGNNWINSSRTVYTFNSGGNITSTTQQIFNPNSNSWTTTTADTVTFNGQNLIASSAHYNPNPTIKKIYVTGNPTAIIIQHGDSLGNWINYDKTETLNTGGNNTQEIYYKWINNAWVPLTKTEINYTSNSKEEIHYIWMAGSWVAQDKSVTYFSNNVTDSISNYVWINNHWAGDSRTIYFHSSNSADSTLTQIMDTVWIDQTLIVNHYTIGGEILSTQQFHWSDTAWTNESQTTNTYTANGHLLNSYYQEWQDTIWLNISGIRNDYDSSYHAIHNYNLLGNDTGWIFASEIINEVDQYGYPTYQDEIEFYYDANGMPIGQSMYGPSYTTYSQTGQLLGWSGHNIPGGPYYGNNIYINGILLESHGYSETMGGLTCSYDTYYYFADITGDSTLCIGSGTILYADSCPSYTYSWSNGASTSSINVTAPGDYYVNVIHPGGATYQSPTIHITVINQQPYIAPGTDSVMTICGNGYVSLSSPHQNNISYQWYRNDTLIAGENYSTLQMYGSLLVPGIYYFTASNACAVDTSSKTTLHLLHYPSTPAITSSSSISFCAGDSVTLNSTPGYRYEWYPNGETTQSITVHTQGSYFVNVYDSGGCSAHSNTITVSVNPYFVVTIVLNNGVLQSTNSGYKQWFMDGDTIPGATSQNFTPVLQGNYTVAMSSYQGCVSYSNSIYINPAILNISIPHQVFICPNGGLYIGGNSPVLGGTPPYTYHWSPSNNLSTTAASLSLLTNLQNDQTYTLTVTDYLGATASDTVRVIVEHPVKPVLSVSDSTLCLGDLNDLRVRNYPGNFSVQNWVINGDTTGINSNSILPLYGPGIYQVAIRNDHSCLVYSDPDTINMHPAVPAPVINATLDPNACINGNGTLWVNHTAGYSYQWFSSNFSLGTDTFLNVNLPVQYDLQITDSNGCVSVGVFDFDLADGNIQISGATTPAQICDFDSVVYHAAQLTGWTYQWYDSDNNPLTSGPDIQLQQGETYLCIATSPFGCTATTYGYGNMAQTPNVSVTNNNGVLEATQYSYTSYQWFRNGQEIPGAMNNYFVPSGMGAYYVRIYSYGSGQTCYAYSNTIYIGNCSVHININNTLSCISNCNGALTAVASGVAPFNYQWTHGSTNASLTGLCSGMFVVVMTDSTGCAAADTAYIGRDSVTFTITTIHPSCSGCTDGSIQISNVNTANYSIQWQPGIGTVSNNIIQNLTSGIYQVCVDNPNTCILCVTDTLVDSPLGIKSFSSNSFSYFPNPVNDKLNITGLPEKDIFEITIYDKTGRIVNAVRTFSKQFDVSIFAAGIYTMEFRNEKNIYRLLFIKN